LLKSLSGSKKGASCGAPFLCALLLRSDVLCYYAVGTCEVARGFVSSLLFLQVANIVSTICAMKIMTWTIVQREVPINCLCVPARYDFHTLLARLVKAEERIVP
jgi:hypothetical protein